MSRTDNTWRVGQWNFNESVAGTFSNPRFSEHFTLWEMTDSNPSLLPEQLMGLNLWATHLQTNEPPHLLSKRECRLYLVPPPPPPPLSSIISINYHIDIIVLSSVFSLCICICPYHMHMLFDIVSNQLSYNKILKELRNVWKKTYTVHT